MPSQLQLKTATLALALATSLAVSPSQSKAGTDTGNLAVSVEVVQTCSVDGGTLDFGAYTGGQSSAADATGSIRYLGCGQGALTFTLDGGNSGDASARTLSSAAGSNLNYQLYRDQSRTQIWAADANAMTLQLLIAGSGTVPIYGRIPGGQEAAAGSYTDSVNITLTF